MKNKKEVRYLAIYNSSTGDFYIIPSVYYDIMWKTFQECDSSLPGDIVISPDEIETLVMVDTNTLREIRKQLKCLGQEIYYTDNEIEKYYQENYNS